MILVVDEVVEERRRREDGAGVGGFVGQALATEAKNP